eukprot:SAG11_NODE_21477_length_424_cov_1.107692_2_plen_58_part_01
MVVTLLGIGITLLAQDTSPALAATTTPASAVPAAAPHQLLKLQLLLVQRRRSALCAGG